MVAATILRRPKTTFTHAASGAHRHIALNPELVDEPRERIEKPAHTSILALTKDLGLKLWKRLEDLDQWVGGAPLTKRDREARERLDIHSGNTHLMIM